MKRKFLFIAVLALYCSVSTAQSVYLFSYFTGQKDGLHLAYSHNGLTWSPLFGGQSILRPEVGKDRLMRDPSICQGPDGTFHMVWTSSWHDRIIGYASSRDLIHWSEQRALPVMEHEPEAKNCWAPELFYDDKSGEFYILWATTIPGRHKEIPVSERDKGNNHRIYYCTTHDFQTFSPVKLYFNPDFIVIDAAIVKDEKKHDYLMVVKNENSMPAEKNLRITRTKDLNKGFSTKVSKPINGDYWCEGPSPLFIGDTLYVYFDRYRDGRYGAVRSTDHGKTWQDISTEVRFPEGIRHGTAFRVDNNVLENLLRQGQSPYVFRRSRVFNIKDYATIQKTIDAAALSGGGTVVIPKGTHPTGALFFPKDVDLWLDRGARLESIVDTTLYPIIDTRFEGVTQKRHAALLNFIDNDSCLVGGEGTIDGKGRQWAALPQPHYGRPVAMRFTRCHEGKVEGLTLIDQASWGLHIYATDGFAVKNMQITVQDYVPSSDGIDIECSSHVSVTGCTISTHDDCISIKSGKGEAAWKNPQPSHDILIEDCHFGYGHGVVAIGSELSGGVHHVTVRRCTVSDNNWSLVRIKSQPSRGGYVRDVLFEDILLKDVRQFVDINLAWRMRGNDSIPAPTLTTVDDVVIRRVTGTAEKKGDITGYPDLPLSPNAIRFEDCHVTLKSL